MNDLYINVMLDKDEWRGYSIEQRKDYMQRLSALGAGLAEYLYECLLVFENELAKENQISIEKTMQYYYGDE